MADRIYIADKPTLDEVRNTLDQVNILLSQLNILVDTNLDAKVGSRQANWGATTTHRDRIDTTISSRASQATVNTINTNVNNINSKINAGVGIKSVQRGSSHVVKINSNETPAGAGDITISPVNVSKSFVNTIYSYSQGSGSSSVSVKLKNSNTVTIEVTGNQLNTMVSWEVIEFY